MREYDKWLTKQLMLFDKEPDEYKKLDTEKRIIDIILEPTKPEIWLDTSIDNFFDFDNSKDLKHSKVKKYKHMGKIDMPRAQ